VGARALAAERLTAVGGPAGTGAAARSVPTRHAELLILCARIGFNP
jgi:hypothetical protein